MDIEIEYPDRTIHKVECYKLCSAMLPDGKAVHFIEYIDKYQNKRVDSYAILEYINDRWVKSKDTIPYQTLAANKKVDLPLSLLPKRISYNTYSYNFSYDSSVDKEKEQAIEDKIEPQLEVSPVRQAVEPKFDLSKKETMSYSKEEEHIFETQTDPKMVRIDPPEYEPKRKNVKKVYVPILVDSQNFQISRIVDVNYGWQLETINQSTLNDEEVASMLSAYPLDTIDKCLESGTFKHTSAKYKKEEVPDAIKSYIYGIQNAAIENQKLADFDELKPLQIEDTEYIFVKNFGLHDIQSFESVEILTPRDEPNINALESFLSTNAFNTIAKGNVDGVTIKIGMTKDKKIEMLTSQVLRQQQIIAELTQVLEQQKAINVNKEVTR